MKTAKLGLAVAAVVGLAACGEKPQIVQYQQGKYQGKADTRPWEGPAFKSDKAAWETALANRAQGQNDYKRAQ